jgi:hypothetical protein
MFYLMPQDRRRGRHGESMPPQMYLETIVRGFFDCGLNVESIEPALASAAAYEKRERERMRNLERLYTTKPRSGVEQQSARMYDEPFEFVDDEDLLDRLDAQALADSERDNWNIDDRQIPLRFTRRKKRRAS